MEINIAAILQGGGTILIAIGLAVTWIRNGKSQGEKYGILTGAVTELGKKQDKANTRLDSIDSKVDKFEVHCARTSSGLIERVKAAERDIHEIKGEVHG